MMDEEPVGTAENLLPRLAKQLQDLDVIFLTLDRINSGTFRFSEEDEERFGLEGDVAPDITHQYARVLTRIIEALQTVPEFSDGAGLVALRALQLDLVALDEGNNPRRLQPREGRSVGADNAGRRIAKANLVLCVRLLEEMKVSETQARIRVASIFAAAGHRGKQGGPLSPGTVYNWRNEIMSIGSPGRLMIETEIDKWKSSPSWPPSDEEATAFIQRRAANPIFSLAHTT